MFLSTTTWAGDRFRLKSQDKQLHMTASYSLALTSTLLLEKEGMERGPSVAIASLFTLAIGTAKELLVDETHSPGDQIANALGAATSAITVFVFEF